MTAKKINKWIKNVESFAYIKGKKDDPTSVILIEQGEAGKSIEMFEDLAVK